MRAAANRQSKALKSLAAKRPDPGAAAPAAGRPDTALSMTFAGQAQKSPLFPPGLRYDFLNGLRSREVD